MFPAVACALAVSGALLGLGPSTSAEAKAPEAKGALSDVAPSPEPGIHSEPASEPPGAAASDGGPSSDAAPSASDPGPGAPGSEPVTPAAPPTASRTGSPPGESLREGPTLPRAPEPGEPVARENWRLVVAGDVLIGVGMGAFGVMVAGLAIRAQGADAVDRLSLRDTPDPAARDEAEAKVRLGNQLAIAGGVGAGVLVGSGIALIVTGHARERKRRARPAMARVGGWADGRDFGLSLSGRF